MKPRARFVNVGRGGTVDEAALVEALRAGTDRRRGARRVRGGAAAAESPLWDMPNVIVSPAHVRATSTGGRRVVELFVDNLGRYVRGRAAPQRGRQAARVPRGIGFSAMSERVIEVRGLRKSLRRRRGGAGDRPPRRARRGLRAARTERRRQDDDRRDPRGLPAEDARARCACSGTTRRSGSVRSSSGSGSCCSRPASTRSSPCARPSSCTAATTRIRGPSTR